MAVNIPGAFASLSSGLLARKGAAKPAMRPQGFGQMGASLEDLGWNDMGFEAPKPTVSPQARDADHDGFGDAVSEQPLRNPVAALTPSPVHGQQAELAARLAEADDAGEPEELDEEETLEADGTLPALAPPVLASPVLRAALPPVIDGASTGNAEAGLPEALAAEAIAFKPQAPIIAITPRPIDEPAPTIALAVAAPVIRAAGGSGPKAAFTLRLDAARHLRLRLACALTGRSAQMLVVQAVDKLLADYPELDTFAASLPDNGRTRRAKG